MGWNILKVNIQYQLHIHVYHVHVHVVSVNLLLSIQFPSSLSRASLTMGSQETFLSNYEGNSQDMRRGHQKRRLASSRGRLANIEEPEKDFTSSGTSNRSLSTSTLPTSTLPTPISPSTASTTVVSPKRKISYMTAVSKAWDSPVYNDSLQSVNENSSITTLKSPSSHSEFSFSRPIPSKAHTNPAPNTTLPHPASQTIF